MKLTALKFDGSENGCQSLRILAELIRRGEITAMPVLDGAGVLRVEFTEPTRRARRLHAGSKS